MTAESSVPEHHRGRLKKATDGLWYVTEDGCAVMVARFTADLSNRSLRRSRGLRRKVGRITCDEVCAYAALKGAEVIECSLAEVIKAQEEETLEGFRERSDVIETELAIIAEDLERMDRQTEAGS